MKYLVRCREVKVKMKKKFETETMNILDVLQRRGRIQMLKRAFDLEKERYQWGDFKDLGYSDSTFRTAMREFVDLRLMETELSKGYY